MKKTVLFELLFFLILPLLVWNYGRDFLGDYWAILLSTVPALIFGIIQFVIQKQFNFTGIMYVSGLLIGVIVDLLSPNAEQMLWNGIYLTCLYACVFLVSILIKKPIALYFSVDFAYLQGYKRENSIALFFRKELINAFQWMTAMFLLRNVFFIVLKSWMLLKYGVDGYFNMIIVFKISGWVFNGIIFVGYILVTNKINIVVKELYGEQTEDKVEVAESVSS